MNLMDLLQGHLSDDFVDQLSNQIGGADREQTEAAASGVMTTLVSALARNASTNQGASALSNALDRDHDGSILNDVFGMLTGGQAQNSRTTNGEGILNHTPGDRQSGAVDMISRLSGLDQGKTGNLMSLLAPVVMGALGKAKQSNGLDAAGIASLLSGTVSAHQESPTMGFINKFLDADGDGSIIDDVASIGMKLLGGFFSRKR
ncbi:MAG TPA: DUF937 domain-containing protein [Flavilitoribacter sp.]|nr:DUF937 domain-containing protein [Flavilitoribacter sp.]